MERRPETTETSTEGAFRQEKMCLLHVFKGPCSLRRRRAAAHRRTHPLVWEGSLDEGGGEAADFFDVCVFKALLSCCSLCTQ